MKCVLRKTPDCGALYPARPSCESLLTMARYGSDMYWDPMFLIDVDLPVAIGNTVTIRAGELAGRAALVIGWRLTRARFTLGGSMDGEPRLSLQVFTEQGDERWVPAADVIGTGLPMQVSVVLPFLGGDEVIVLSSGVAGEIRGWEITGRRLETTVTYRVHLHRAPRREWLEVDSRNLEARISRSA